MPEKSARRLKLEQSLAESPDDSFLRYGLAIQCLREGEAEAGRQCLLALIADEPNHVAAHQQLGQSYAESGDIEDAESILKQGIAKALSAGDRHAASEMSGLLETLG